MNIDNDKSRMQLQYWYVVLLWEDNENIKIVYDYVNLPNKACPSFGW